MRRIKHTSLRYWLIQSCKIEHLGENIGTKMCSHSYVLIFQLAIDGTHLQNRIQVQICNGEMIAITRKQFSIIFISSICQNKSISVIKSLVFSFERFTFNIMRNFKLTVTPFLKYSSFFCYFGSLVCTFV